MSGIDFASRISYEPYHIYYDLNILNNDTTGTQRPPFLQFTEIRNSPYLTNPNDYFCSVVRFSVETPTLPVLIPQVKLGGTVAGSENDTVYSVTLSHQTLLNPATTPALQQFVQFIPQSSLALFPPPTPSVATPIAASAPILETSQPSPRTSRYLQWPCASSRDGLQWVQPQPSVNPTLLKARHETFSTRPGSAGAADKTQGWRPRHECASPLERCKRSGFARTRRDHSTNGIRFL